MTKMKIDGEKIKQKREEKGFSRADIARLSDIPVRTLQDWELGVRNPTNYFHLKALSELLNTEIDEFVEEEEPQNDKDLQLLKDELLSFKKENPHFFDNIVEVPKFFYRRKAKLWTATFEEEQTIEDFLAGEENTEYTFFLLDGKLKYEVMK